MARKEFFDEKAKHDMNNKNPKPVFKLKQLYMTSDTTYEGLIANLAKTKGNTATILIKAEELGTFFNSFYTGKKDNTEHWLQCYGGKLEPCIRKSDDNQVIPPENGTICVTGGCQPSILKEYLKKNMFTESGLTWRFLIVHIPHLNPIELPKNKAEYEYTYTQLENAEDKLRQIFEELLGWRKDTVLDGNLPPLSSDMEEKDADKTLWNSMFNDEPISPEENTNPAEDQTDKLTIIGTDQKGEDVLWEINHDISYNCQDIPDGAKGKAPGQIVRIALIFAKFDNPKADIVEAKYLQNAYILWKWLVQCQQTLLGNNETEVSQMMKEIEEYMGKQPIHEEVGLHFCTKRDLNRKFHNTRHYNQALGLLTWERTILEEPNPKHPNSKLLFYQPSSETKDTV